MTTAVVYRAFDSAGRLLYVGCTADVERRMRQHAWGSAWHPYMTSLVVSDRFPIDRAQALEDEAIKDERPFFNKTKSETGALTYVSRYRIARATEHMLAGLQFDEAMASAEADRRRHMPTAPTADYIHSHYLAIVENARRELEVVNA